MTIYRVVFENIMWEELRKKKNHYLTSPTSGGTFQNANDGWVMVMKVSKMIFSLISPSCPLVSGTFFLFITFGWLACLFLPPACEQNVTGNWNETQKLRVVLLFPREQRNKGTLWCVWATLFPALTRACNQSPSQSLTLALTSQLLSLSHSLTRCLSRADRRLTGIGRRASVTV